jgi:hypothetical protein
VHLTTNSSATINYNDREVALLVSEATERFNPVVIEQLKMLAAGQPTDTKNDTP